MKQKNIKLKNTSRVRKFNGVLRKSSRINHVVRHPNGWAVKKSGAKKASRILSSQSEAVRVADGMAQRSNGGTVIHRRDGRIREVRVQ